MRLKGEFLKRELVFLVPPTDAMLVRERVPVWYPFVGHSLCSRESSESSETPGAVPCLARPVERALAGAGGDIGHEFKSGTLWWTSFRWGFMSTDRFSGDFP